MRTLLISYHFPPDAEIGAVRPYQFARLLPTHGIDPYVLTVEAQFAERREEHLVPDGIPPERILRTLVRPSRLDHALHLSSPLRTSLRRRRSADVLALPAKRSEILKNDISGTSRLKSYLLAWLGFPDIRAGWYGPAVARS